jgi:hypothetical protein
MTPYWKAFLFWGAYCCICGYAFWWLANHSGKVHKALANYRKEAENAIGREALLGVRKKLCAYARKECVVRGYGDHAREILAYIDGRLMPPGHCCSHCGAPPEIAAMRNRHSRTCLDGSDGAVCSVCSVCSVAPVDSPKTT